MKKGVLLIVSGPSGAGKGTVVSKAISTAGETEPRIYLSVSMTSRSQRAGEIEGESYFFVSREQFLRSIEDGDLLEYNCFSGNYYGTPKSNVDRHLAMGEAVILEIDVNGGDQIVKKYPEAVRVFIMPPSMEVLENRLRGRGRDSQEDILTRLGEAEREINRAADYDYIIINDRLEDAAAQLLSIVSGKAVKTDNKKEIISEVLSGK